MCCRRTRCSSATTACASSRSRRRRALSRRRGIRRLRLIAASRRSADGAESAADEVEIVEFDTGDDGPPPGYRERTKTANSSSAAADSPDAARAPGRTALAHQAVRARPQARDPADRLAGRRRLSHSEPGGVLRDTAAGAGGRSGRAADRVEAPAAPGTGRHRGKKPERVPGAAARRAAGRHALRAPRRSRR